MDLSSSAPALPAENRNTDERSTLLDMIDFYRIVLLRKAADLTTAQLHATPLPTTLSLGRILAHMAFVEDHWFHVSFAGNPHTAPWDAADFDRDPDWEMSWGEHRDYAELAQQFEASVARSRTAISEVVDLSSRASSTGDQIIALRWILVHMVEEYARHVGHADLIRESLDAQTGD